MKCLLIIGIDLNIEKIKENSKRTKIIKKGE